MKVAIIDDDPYIVEWLKLYLIKENYEVFAYNNGFNLTENLKKNEPDIILLDIMMPGISGYELLEYKKINEIAPVIFMSAKDTVEDKIKGLKLGADDYLVKPFDIEELKARMTVVLRRNKKELSNCLSLENLKLNLMTYEVIYKEKPIHLPQK